MGKLTKVEEPNLAGRANLETVYTDDVLDKLKTVSTTSSGTTQTRTFRYNVKQELQSVAHSENGTTTHTYKGNIESRLLDLGFKRLDSSLQLQQSSSWT